MKGIFTDIFKQSISMTAGNLRDFNVRCQSHHLPNTNINQWQFNKRLEIPKKRVNYFSFAFQVFSNLQFANSSISRHGYSLSNL